MAPFIAGGLGVLAAVYGVTHCHSSVFLMEIRFRSYGTHWWALLSSHPELPASFYEDFFCSKSRSIMSFANNLVSAFGKMLENDFSQQVLIPLFSAMDYRRVQFHGGANERGRDIIAEAEDRFGDIEVAVFVVKKLSASTAAGESRTFHTAIRQLEQCCENPVECIDAITRLPSQVALVTPHEISVRQLESRFQKMRQLRERNVKIYDGRKIAELSEKYIPEICETLVAAPERLATLVSPLLTNRAVMRVLNRSAEIPVDAFHVSLDSSLGSEGVHSLFNSKFSVANTQVETSYGNFEDVRRDIHEEISYYSIGMDLVSLDSLKVRHSQIASIKQQIESIKQGIERKDKSSRNKEKDLKTLRNAVQKEKDRLQAELDDGQRRARKLQAKIDNSTGSAVHLSEDRKNHKETERQIKRIKVDIDVCEQFENLDTLIYSPELDGKLTTILRKYSRRFAQIRGSSTGHASDFKEYVELKLELGRLKQQLQDLERELDDTQPTIDIDSALIAKELERVADAGRMVVAKLKAEHDLAAQNQLFGEFGIFASRLFGIFQFASRYRLVTICERTKVKPASFPLRAVFASGASVLLLGEAGSGKSTSLQAYAKQLISSRRGFEDSVLFVPLGQLSIKPNRCDSEEGLVQAITSFLQKHGGSVTCEGINKVLATNGTVCILDAIDELTFSSDIAIRAIEAFRKAYPQLQIIVSSRDTTPKLQNLSFTPVVLRPFSKSQLRTFVKSYCHSRKAESAGSRVLEHLRSNTEMSEIVRNPLLATVLIEIAIDTEAGLPPSESQLYYDRFRLLSGELDSAKQILRRVRFNQAILAEVCAKLAFDLHSKSVRSLDKLDLTSTLIEAGVHGLKRSDAPSVIADLLNPCQILVPMDALGQIGFGHLRFQEYFAAQELKHMQFADCVSLMRIPWWRDVFVLFAKSASKSNVLQFLAQANINVLESSVHQTLLAMVKVLPTEFLRDLEVHWVASSVRGEIFLKDAGIAPLRRVRKMGEV